jgi:hypothetical protein
MFEFFLFLLDKFFGELMEEPEKVLSSYGTSETLDGSVGGQVKVVGEDGVCNGQDEVGFGDSVKGGENLSEDVKSVGIGDGTEVQFEDSRVELGSVVSEREVRDEAVVVETTPGDVTMEDAVEGSDHEVTNSSCDNALGGENVRCESEEKEKQNDGNVIGHGTPEDGNDVIVENDKILDKGACVGDDVYVVQPIGNDKVDIDSDDVHEVVYGTGVEIDKTLLNASDAEQSDVHEGMQIDVVDQQGTERSKTMNHTAEIKGKISIDVIAACFLV